MKKECPSSPSICIVLEGPSQYNKSREKKENKVIQEGEIKMELFMHDMIRYLKSLKESIDKIMFIKMSN